MLPFLTHNFSPRLLRAAGELLPFDALHMHFKLVDTLTAAAVNIFQEKKRLYASEEKMNGLAMSKGRDLLSILCMLPFQGPQKVSADLLQSTRTARQPLRTI